MKLLKKKENPKPKINFDDMFIFNKKDNKRIDINIDIIMVIFI